MSDPHTPFMIGRLIGANEMAVVVLMQQPPPGQVERVAQALDLSVGYFMERVPNVPRTPVTTPPRS